MAQPPVALHISEDTESDGQEPSPCNEGAMHTSFRQLIQEQSSLVEAAAGAELEMPARDRESPEPQQGDEHARYSSATLRILASMPKKRSLLVKELLSLSPGQRSHMLLSVPLSLAEKRTLRQELSGQRGSPREDTQRGAPFSPCGRSKYHIILGCRGLWYGLLSLLPAVQPWHHALKQIGSRFGSSVLSYFLFLKTLLGFNVFLFLLLLVFVVALQAAYPPAPASHQPFTGLELLTGAGYFTRSLLYYGYYSNVTLNEPCAARPNCSAAAPPLPYNMPLAYVFTVGVSFFLTCILLVYSMSRSFGESYRVGGPVGDLAIKVFCAWDFKVVRKRWVKLQSENIRTQLKRLCLPPQCWETCVGQDLYRFVVMDFIFTLLDTIFGELLWRLVLEKRLKRKQRPEFDIARNVLELIYGQTLTWLGVLFSPLLPAVQIVKLLLLFYIKKTSLMQNCQSPSKPWQASRMSTVFITLLCFPSFLGAAIFLSYTIWSVKPSETCGPFQGMETIYESGKTWVRLLEKSNPNITWFTWVHQYLLENTFFLFFVSGVLLAVIYFNIQVVKGQRRIIHLLKEQIANEGEDKIFLIQKLHSVYEQRERRS
nr:PREDICTED: transmembrane channel-like protein 6 [Apteryx mantelli mantelli]